MFKPVVAVVAMTVTLAVPSMVRADNHGDGASEAPAEQLDSASEAQAASGEAESSHPPATPAEPEDNSEGERAYDREFVGYRGDQAYHAGKRVEGAAFYKAIGRDDLASKYKARSTRRALVVMGGGGGALVGAIVLLKGVGKSCDSISADSWCDARKRLSLTFGSGLLALGGGVAVLGASMNLHPVSTTEARRLAKEHNGGLRKKYRIDPNYRPRSRSSLNVHLAPTLTPDLRGGGLVVLGRF